MHNFIRIRMKKKIITCSNPITLFFSVCRSASRANEHKSTYE